MSELSHRIRPRIAPAIKPGTSGEDFIERDLGGAGKVKEKPPEGGCFYVPRGAFMPYLALGATLLSLMVLN